MDKSLNYFTVSVCYLRNETLERFSFFSKSFYRYLFNLLWKPLHSHQSRWQSSRLREAKRSSGGGGAKFKIKRKSRCLERINLFIGGAKCWFPYIIHLIYRHLNGTTSLILVTFITDPHHAVTSIHSTLWELLEEFLNWKFFRKVYRKCTLSTTDVRK